MLQPMSHSPHRRQVVRCRPCRLPYGGSTIGSPGPGAAPGAGAKLTASGGNCQGRPSSAAASCMARVLRVAAYGATSSG